MQLTMKQYFICIVVALCAFSVAAENHSLSGDEPMVSDTVGWITALKQGKLDFNDSTIHYPRVMRAGYNSLQWYNHTFNDYDTAYVASVGKLWRITVKNENWMDRFVYEYNYTKSNQENLGLSFHEITCLL